MTNTDTKNIKPTVFQVNDTCVRIVLGQDVDTELTQRVQATSKHVLADFGDAIIDHIPAFTSVLLQFKDAISCWQSTRQALIASCEKASQDFAPLATKATIKIPVYYDQEVGPDLSRLSQIHQLNPQEVIAHHQAPCYTVYALGFSPGFAFMGKVVDAIATARLACIRQQVAAGSVGIANQQTGIYPSLSPGGWNIIGRTPLPMLIQADNLSTQSRLSVGDRVQFQAISRAEFLALGGTLS